MAVKMDDSNFITTFTLIERVDTKKVKELLGLDLSQFDADEGYSHNALKSFLSGVERGKNRVTYNLKSYGYGRMYTENASYVTLPGEIRNYLAKDFYSDVDIRNCHPSILHQDMISFYKDGLIETRSEFIEDYVLRRNETMSRFNFNKTDFIKCMYTESKNYSNENTFLKEVNKYINDVILPVYITKYNSIYQESVDSYKSSGNYSNQAGSFLASVLQSIERRIITTAYKYVTCDHSPKLKVGAIPYDGIMIEQGKTIKFQKISDYVRDKTGYVIEFVEKPMTHPTIDKIIEETNNSNESKYITWKSSWEKYFFFVNYEKGSIMCERNGDLVPFKKHEVKDLIPASTDLGHLFDDEMFEKWYRDPCKRAYDNFDFFPEPMVCPSNIYNTWKGFSRSSNTSEFSENHIQDIWNTYDEFYNHLARNDPKVKEYLIQMDAHLIQKPGIKPGVCIIMKGKQGAGKGTRGRLLNALISDDYFYSTGDSDKVLGRFTKPVSKKLVLELDECVSNKMFESSARLKNLITEKTYTIEGKGESAYNENSFCRVVGNTNYENPVKIEASDRRYVILEVDTIDPQLAVSINALIDNDESVQVLFQKLANYPLKYKSMYDFQENRPLTDAYDDVRSQVIPNYYKFMYKFVTDIPQKSLDRVTNNELRSFYHTFCINNEKVVNPVSDNMLFKMIKKIDGVVDSNSNSIRFKRIDKTKALKWFTDNNYTYNDYTDPFVMKEPVIKSSISAFEDD